MGKLDGKVALVTGAGRGIGRAIALKLASEGARLVLNDLDEEPAAEVAGLIRDRGGEVVACNGDVTAPDFGDRFVGLALHSFGGLHIVVNNAGYTWPSPIEEMTDAQFQAMVDVHTVAPFRILRAAAEPIRIASKQENAEGNPVYRKVVNISSIVGLYGKAGQAAYSTAKASLVGLTRTMCKEWGRYNVNVNCVAYGWIETRLTEAIESGKPQPTIDIAGRTIRIGVDGALQEMGRPLIPLQRPGTAEEAADAVYLFCSPESNYISGQILLCAGGLII